MSSGSRKASHITAPNDVARTANDFGVGKFAVTTTYGVNPLPAEWAGKWVDILFTGAASYVHVAFSKSPTAEVDTTVSAAAAGATTALAIVKVGKPLAVGEWHSLKLPEWAAGETMYLVRDGDGSATGFIALA